MHFDQASTIQVDYTWNLPTTYIYSTTLIEDVFSIQWNICGRALSQK